MRLLQAGILAMLLTKPKVEFRCGFSSSRRFAFRVAARMDRPNQVAISAVKRTKGENPPR